MLKHKSSPNRGLLVLICGTVILGLTLGAVPQTFAQESGAVQADRARGLELFNQNKFADAIPILEKVAKATPRDVAVLESLGWATLVVSSSMKDPTERKKARQRARGYLQRAQELGDDSELLRRGLEGLQAPDESDSAMSNSKEADRAMREGEEAHSRGELDKAIEAYQRALKFDLKLYFAALFTGDMYFKKGYQASDPKTKQELMNKAGEWFAKAIAIDANLETAYRYWGDALMHSGKQEEAMQKFVDAIIAEPGNRSGYVGLKQWGERNQRSMRHPTIEIPIKLTSAGPGKLDVNFDPALRESPDGTGAWEHYGLVRAQWVAEQFAKSASASWPNRAAAPPNACERAVR